MARTYISCPVCGHRILLRKDGRLAKHHRKGSSRRQDCPQSLKPHALESNAPSTQLREATLLSDEDTLAEPSHESKATLPEHLPIRRWETIRDWTRFAVAVSALIVAVLVGFEGRRNATKTRDIEVDRLLDQAWDLLGGKPGTIEINDFVKDRGQQELARRLIEGALRKSPKSPRAHRVRVVYLHAQGKLEEAEESCNYALKIDPDDAATHNALGNILRARRKLAEAELSYRRAVDLDPVNAVLHSNLGHILRDQEKLEEAEASFRHATDLDPNNAVAHTDLGVVLHDQGKLEEAEASYRRVLEIYPEGSARWLYNLAVVLNNQGKLDEAETIYRRSVLLFPGPITHKNFGDILSMRGKLAEAEANYRRALELKPDYEKARRNLNHLLSTKSP